MSPLPHDLDADEHDDLPLIAALSQAADQLSTPPADLASRLRRQLRPSASDVTDAATETPVVQPISKPSPPAPRRWLAIPLAAAAAAAAVVIAVLNQGPVAPEISTDPEPNWAALTDLGQQLGSGLARQLPSGLPPLPSLAIPIGADEAHPQPTTSADDDSLLAAGVPLLDAEWQALQRDLGLAGQQLQRLIPSFNTTSGG